MRSADGSSAHLPGRRGARRAASFHCYTGAAAMITTVLFDLGGTLAAYYQRREFVALRDEGVARVTRLLRRHGGSLPQTAELARRVAAEDYEATDQRVRPLELRLARIFAGSTAELAAGLLNEMCAAFLAPIFARGTLYDDALPALRELRGRGLKLGLVSNTPWGSPAELWQAELGRLGLDGLLDSAVFCRDCGWRKPAGQIFRETCARMTVVPGACLFVGDHPRWDVAGAQQAGMRAVQLCRGREPTEAVPADHPGSLAAVSGLGELPDLICRL